MAIAYGAYTSDTSGSNTNSFTGPSITGTNTYLLVGLCLNAVGGTAPTSIQYDGVDMTLLGISDAVDAHITVLYGLINPGSAKTVSYSGNFYASSAVAAYYTGVNQTTPSRTATDGSGASPGPATLSITNSAVNDLIVGFFGSNDTYPADGFTEARIGSGQTFRAQVTDINDVTISFGEEAGASGTVTHSWAYNGAYAWTAIAVPLIPVSDSVSALPRRALDGPFYGSLRGSVR